jgi:superfamily II DNA/RNA helicase
VSEVFTVITETREAADQFAREGEAACIYVDTIEWCKTFRGMA